MHRVVFALAACIAATPLILPSKAEARHIRHSHHTTIHRSYSYHRYAHHYSRRAYTHDVYYRHSYAPRAYSRRGYALQNFRQSYAMATADGGERVIGSRPSGCPHAFCGCEASLYKFGRIIPELNLASNWYRFPRAAPSPGMAAVRPGHVMILESQVAGNIWLVHDGNSGGHVTREHARSLAGYTIVNPGAGSRYARASRFM